MRHFVFASLITILQNFVRQVSYNDVRCHMGDLQQMWQRKTAFLTFENLAGKYRRNQAEVFMPQSVENNGGQ